MSEDYDLAGTWLTIAQAQARVLRSRDTLERWIRKGMLHPIQITADGRGRAVPRTVVNEAELVAAEYAARRANPTKRRTEINDAVSYDP